MKLRFFDFKDHFDNISDVAKTADYNTTQGHQSVGYIDWKSRFEFKGTHGKFDPAHKHIFHDKLHPSQEVHQLLASRITDFVASQFGKPRDQETHE